MAKEETVNEPKDLIEPTPEEMNKMELENGTTNKEETESVEEIVAEAEKDEKVVQEKEMTFAEKRAAMEKKALEESISSWKPKTAIGREVKEGKMKDIDSILKNSKKILESEIVDSLLKLENDLISIGQAKGKFGGGKRRAWRQTQKKTKEGNILTFSCMAVVGDKKGHVGVGYGKAKETLPAREKSNKKS